MIQNFKALVYKGGYVDYALLPIVIKGTSRPYIVQPDTTIKDLVDEVNRINMGSVDDESTEEVRNTWIHNLKRCELADIQIRASSKRENLTFGEAIYLLQNFGVDVKRKDWHSECFLTTKDSNQILLVNKKYHTLMGRERDYTPTLEEIRSEDWVTIQGDECSCESKQKCFTCGKGVTFM